MIYVVGSLAYDYIMDFPGRFSDQIIPEKIHLISISFLVNTLREGFGGTAGNIAYSLALLGVKNSIIASAGFDFAPYKKFLVKNNVNTAFIKVVGKVQTAKAFITTDLSNNQITGFYRGALQYDKSLKLPEAVSDSDFVIISPTDPKAVDNFLDSCIEKQLSFMFDPGMQLPRLSAKTLQKGIENARILIGNDYEIALLKKKTGINKWGFIKKEQIIVTTLGEKGCQIETAKQTITVPGAKPLKVVDPTGAGDAFRSGFLAGFSRGFSSLICGRMGNVSAVFTVEKYGTTTHKFTKKEFNRRYYKNYKEKLNL